MKIDKKVCSFVVGVLACLAGGEAWAQDRGQGQAVYDLWCAPCHKPLSAEDRAVAGTGVLERKYQGTRPAALEQRTDLTPDVVKYFVRQGASFMPPFRKTQIADDELDAMAAYLANDPQQLERAAGDVREGRTPSRASRGVPLTFTPPPRLPWQARIDTPGVRPLPVPALAVTGEKLTDPQVQGKALFEKACLYCHGDGDPAKLLDRRNLTRDYIRRVVANGVGRMPPYPPLDLSNAEFDLIAAFLTRSNR